MFNHETMKEEEQFIWWSMDAAVVWFQLRLRLLDVWEVGGGRGWAGRGELSHRRMCSGCDWDRPDFLCELSTTPTPVLVIPVVVAAVMITDQPRALFLLFYDCLLVIFSF